MPFATISHYFQPGVMNADARTMFGGHRIAASRRFPMGTVIRFNYGGRSMRVTVCDRGGDTIVGNRFDFPLMAFCALGGLSHREANRQGLLRHVRFQVVRLGRPNHKPHHLTAIHRNNGRHRHR